MLESLYRNVQEADSPLDGLILHESVDIHKLKLLLNSSLFDGVENKYMKLSVREHLVRYYNQYKNGSVKVKYIRSKIFNLGCYTSILFLYISL